MALPAHILQRLPASLTQKGLLHCGEGSLHAQAQARSAARSKTSSLSVDEERDPTGWLHAVQEGEFPTGGVIELCLSNGLSFGTSLALNVCRATQERGRQLSGTSSWCAFIDPSASLYAPGVERAGIDLSRFLVVRPEAEAVSRLAIRLVESQVFGVVIVDLVGAPGGSTAVEMGSWVRVVRRLSLALEKSDACAVLLTDQKAHRPMPLPVAQRVEVNRVGARKLIVNVPKDRRGTPCGPLHVAWSRAQKNSHAA